MQAISSSLAVNMTDIVNGKKIIEEILNSLSKKIKQKRLKLFLVGVLVGDDPASIAFIEKKEEACRRIGIKFKTLKLPKSISQESLKERVKAVSGEKDVNGVIVQLPLPPKIKTWEILDAVPWQKDVDVLSGVSVGKFYNGGLPITPPTVSSIKKIFDKYKIKIKGKNVVIIGSGRLIGRPLAVWLLKEDATVTIVNRFTKNISFFSKQADILIAGAGSPNLIKGNMLKRGSIVIDAGYSLVRGKIVGDINLKSVLGKSKLIAPSPGGIGPITVACLLENLVVLNSQKSKIGGGRVLKI